LLDGISRRIRARRSRLSSALKTRILRAFVGRNVSVPEGARTHDAADLERRTDELNVAAEDYFVEAEDPEFLIHKPFSDPSHFAKYLFNLGILIQKGHMAPGHRVLELGAGAGWVSHFLNRFGCRTVALDVSQTALDLAEETFRRDPATRWDTEPRFLTYDGHRIPLEDGSCDRVIVHDAFHHIPNQREILGELARILVPGGIVAMNEPGRCHSASEQSRREMSQFGVLENDIVVEDLAALACTVGFTHTTVLPINLHGATEIPAERLVEFVRGERLAEWWCEMAPHLLNEHYIFLHKGAYIPDTRTPGKLRAEIALDLEPPTLDAATGEPMTIRCRVTNAGDTRWLPESAGRPGGVQLAGYLEPPGGGKVERDWLRTPLEASVEPGESVTLELEVPPFGSPGERVLVLDLVAEGVTWFEDVGSKPTRVQLLISS